MNFHNMIVTFHNTSYEITHVIKINNKNVMNFNNIFNSGRLDLFQCKEKPLKFSFSGKRGYKWTGRLKRTMGTDSLRQNTSRDTLVMFLN